MPVVLVFELVVVLLESIVVLFFRISRSLSRSVQTA